MRIGTRRHNLLYRCQATVVFERSGVTSAASSPVPPSPPLPSLLSQLPRQMHRTFASRDGRQIPEWLSGFHMRDKDTGPKSAGAQVQCTTGGGRWRSKRMSGREEKGGGRWRKREGSEVEANQRIWTSTRPMPSTPSNTTASRRRDRGNPARSRAQTLAYWGTMIMGVGIGVEEEREQEEEQQQQGWRRREGDEEGM
eukprot:9471424-Pyramimonas_sp.AAC.1